MQHFNSLHFHSRNLKLFYLYKFLEGFVLIYPVYMIFFRSRGLSFTELSLLILIWAAPVVLCEVPSGVLADRWSRKGTVAIGMVFKAVGFLIWALVDNIAGAALGFICWGLQEAFCSGSLEAFLYDDLKAVGRADVYDRVAGLGSFFQSAAIALSLLAGGLIFSLNPLVTFLLSSASCLAAGVIALCLSEPPLRQRTPGEGTSAFQDFIEGFRECVRNKTILSLVFVGCLAGSGYGLLDEYDSLWGNLAVGVPVAFIGFWGATRYGIEALGGRLAGVLNRKLGLAKNSRVRLYLIAAGGLLALAAVLPPRFGIPAYFAFFFLMAAGHVLIEQRLQDAIERSSRATLLSINSLVTTLAAMGFSPVIGVLADAFGLPASLLAAAVLTALGAAVLFGQKE
jgi:MFS family permease